MTTAFVQLSRLLFIISTAFLVACFDLSSNKEPEQPAVTENEDTVQPPTTENAPPEQTQPSEVIDIPVEPIVGPIPRFVDFEVVSDGTYFTVWWGLNYSEGKSLADSQLVKPVVDFKGISCELISLENYVITSGRNCGQVFQNGKLFADFSEENDRLVFVDKSLNRIYHFVDGSLRFSDDFGQSWFALENSNLWQQLKHYNNNITEAILRDLTKVYASGGKIYAATPETGAWVYENDQWRQFSTEPSEQIGVYNDMIWVTTPNHKEDETDGEHEIDSEWVYVSFFDPNDNLKLNKTICCGRFRGDGNNLLLFRNEDDEANHQDSVDLSELPKNVTVLSVQEPFFNDVGHEDIIKLKQGHAITKVGIFDLTTGAQVSVLGDQHRIHTHAVADDVTIAFNGSNFSINDKHLIKTESGASYMCTTSNSLIYVDLYITDVEELLRSYVKKVDLNTQEVTATIEYPFITRMACYEDTSVFVNTENGTLEVYRGNEWSDPELVPFITKLPIQVELIGNRLYWLDRSGVLLQTSIETGETSVVDGGENISRIVKSATQNELLAFSNQTLSLISEQQVTHISIPQEYANETLIRAFFDDEHLFLFDAARNVFKVNRSEHVFEQVQFVYDDGKVIKEPWFLNPFNSKLHISSHDAEGMFQLTK